MSSHNAWKIETRRESSFDSCPMHESLLMREARKVGADTIVPVEKWVLKVMADRIVRSQKSLKDVHHFTIRPGALIFT